VTATEGTGLDALRAHWQRRRGRVTDVAFIAVVLVTGIAAVVASAANVPTVLVLWRGALTLVVAVALWWRRSHPTAVATVSVLAVALGASEFSLQVSLFTLAIRRRDRVLALLTGLGAAAFGVAWTLTIGPTEPIAAVVGGIFSGAFFVGLPVALGAYVGARRDLLTSLRERAERAEREQHLRGDQARLAERSRIAQEMHDVLAHKISLVALHAGGLEVNPGAGPEQVERAATLIRTTARQALEDLRDVLGVLRADTTTGGAPLAPQPTLEDLPRLVESSRQAGVPVRFEDGVDAGAATALPPAVARTAYRVVQEGLTNVHKHAPGAAASVRVAGGPGRSLEVEVRNARVVGSGLDGPLVPGAGMGLVGLAERVGLAGGRLHSGPDDAGGFVVRASLPWPAGEGRTA
jgi:signal transduction histidine kinase